MLTSPFVGRRHELAELRQQLELARATGPRLVLIAAEAGVGKTTLVRQFLAAVGADCGTAEGRCWDNQAAASYHALNEALVALPGNGSAAGPTLQAFLHQEETDGRAGLTPMVLFPVLAEYLERQGRARPLCLFLDDLQWADEGTLAWLDYVLHRQSRAPVLWLAAYRQEESASLAPLLARRSHWYRQERLSELVLPPLGQGEVEDLARQMVPAAQWHEDLAARVWRRSEGIALLAVEEIRAAIEGREGGAAGRTLIEARLARLETTDRELLAAATVVGERFAAATVAAVIDQEPLAVARRLERLRTEQGLLVADDGGFRFAHNRFREALLAGLSAPLRQDYHARLGTSTTLSASERTYHLARGGDPGGAIVALLEQGARASHWRDALRFYLEALGLSQKAENLPPELHLAVYQRVGDLHLDLGKHALARPYYEAARSWAWGPRAQALLLLRLAQTSRGHSPAQRQYVQAAYDLLPQLVEPPLATWVRFLRLLMQSGAKDAAAERELEGLGRRLTFLPDLPQRLLEPYWGFFTRRVIAHIEASKADSPMDMSAAIDADSPRDPRGAALYHQSMAMVLASEARWEAYFARLAVARRQFEAVGDELAVTACLKSELDVLSAQLGDYMQVRRRLRETAPQGILAPVYRYGCATWLRAPDAEALDWARRCLQGVEDFYVEYPTDGGHLRALFQELGSVERVFRDLGHSAEFRQRLDELRARIRSVGYHTEGVWHFGAPSALQEPLATGTMLTAGRVSGGSDEAAEWTVETGSMVWRQPNREGPHPNRHWLAEPLAGDFVLQVTLASEEEMIDNLQACLPPANHNAATTCALGGGGLIACRDAEHYLRLSAHRTTPGEVVFEARAGGPLHHLGRGLVAGGPVRLRLERQQNRFAAYAGTQASGWHSCGTIDLPGWDPLEVGLCGELPAPIGVGLAVSVQTRFRDPVLQAASTGPLHTRSGGGLYEMPAPRLDPELPNLVAASPAMRSLLDQVRHAAGSRLPVLIQGETGTGKELIARALHTLGGRANAPFVPLNCASISPELVERELFGHVRGAYTGAYESRGGLFEAADRGILFLDEVDQASPAFQARLLRVIEEQAVRRVGDARLRSVDVRLVAATNRDLAQAMSQGQFRRDLFYRLGGIVLALAPLRCRPDDLVHLVAHFLASWAREQARAVPAVTQSAMVTLCGHDWPGNVRELRHAVERAAAAASDGVITSAHIGLAPPPEPAPQDARAELLTVLRACNNNVSAAARRLQIGRATLYRRLRQAGLR